MKPSIPLISLLAVFLTFASFLYLNQISQTGIEAVNYANFSSPDDFRDYVGRAGYISPFYYTVERGITVSSGLLSVTSPGFAEKGAEADRFSQTNVQVQGIDEPDIVKTDGKNIYISRTRIPYIVKIPYPYMQKTAVVKAYPPDELKKIGELNASGDLLVYRETVLVLSGSSIRAFSLRDFSEKYRVELNGTIAAARLYEGKVFLILSQHSEICPVIPMRVNGEPYIVECTRIYHPIKPVPVEAIYTVVKLDPENGKVEGSISFVGNYASVVYMSKNAVYVAYYLPMDYVRIMLNFSSENRDIFPEWFIQRLQKLEGYELSERAKQVEIFALIERIEMGMKPEERIVFENELRNRFEKYVERHAREIEKTAVWKISLEMKIVANGEFPGRLLNQFSMDEYSDHLRVATTLGRANAVYVLNKDLKIVGSLEGFGETERIYAVRFIADKGYVVTFRETDPFFVIDLSKPESPKMAGELKIQGFSSYLHPLKENLILGVGEEGSYVKLSLFDVSDPKNPVEIDKYLLKEYWSEVIGNHRAFLADEKYEAFFIPASSGYVFSYKEGLKLIRATETGFRAAFIGDYLYIIGSKIVVFDEKSWEKVAELEL